MANAGALDLTVLQWIKGEIDQSLHALAQQLRNSVDAARLSQCIQEVHRLGGALQMAGVEGLNNLCDAIEGALGASNSSPDPVRTRTLAIEAIEALSRYIDELLQGAPHRPMHLFAVYRELRLAQGHDKVSASDLFLPNLAISLPAYDGHVKLSADVAEDIRAARKAFQRGLLVWLKGNSAGLASMRSGTTRMDALRRASTGFWWCTHAFLDAIEKGGLPVDSQIKKLCARIDAQLGRLEKGSESIAEGLHRELLYFVSITPNPTPMTQTLARVYRTRELLPPQNDSEDRNQSARTIALHDQLRAAKELWSRYCEGDAEALAAFSTSLQTLATDVTREAPVEVGSLAQAIHSNLAQGPEGHNAEVRIAVAGALLVAEESLLCAASQRGALTPRVLQAIRSLSAEVPDATGDGTTTLADGIDPTLVAEIMKGLRQVEQHVGAFLRDERKKDELAPAVKHLRQAENILQVVNAAQACVVTRHCLSTLTDWQGREDPTRESEHESFAQALTALDYYLQAKSRGDHHAAEYVRPVLTQLGLQDDAAPAIQVRDEEAREATPSVETEIRTELRQTLSILDNWMRANASTLATLEERVTAIYQDAVLVADKHTEQTSSQALALIQQARNAPLTQLPEAISAMENTGTVVEATGASIDTPSDPEIAEVFLEEADEVLQSLAAQLPRLQAASTEREALTEIRRGFHTLKGSSRVAGLNNYGEAAWSVERTLNHWMEQELAIDASLIAVIEGGMKALQAWTAQLRSDGRCAVDGRALAALATRALSGESEPTAQPPVTPPSVAHRDDPITLGDGASISSTLFAIFRAESRQHIKALREEWTNVAEGKPVGHRFMRAAHTLAGIARTVQLPALADLAYALEQRLQQHLDASSQPDTEALTLYQAAIDELDRTVSAVAALQGSPPANAELLARLNVSRANEPESTSSVPTACADLGEYISDGTLEGTLNRTLSGSLRLEEVDPELRATFLEEAVDLGNALGADLQMWRAEPASVHHGAAVARGLHTLKGSARAAGAMRLGEQVHQIEERVQLAMDEGTVSPRLLDTLLKHFDRWCTTFESLQKPMALPTPAPSASLARDFDRADSEEAEPSVAAQMAAAQLRVRGDAIERLADASGELNIARARMSEEVRGARQVSLDLNDSVKRLRGQLREIEIQAESQMTARLSRMDEADAAFDPLEFDRFTRLQELTRLMAESLHDIGSVQQNLLRHFQDIDAVLVSHTRVNRELHRELSQIQTVPFSSVAERLQRLVRQTAAELGKHAELVIDGAQVELDRRLLDQMLSPLEHILRNALAHGLETPGERRQAGKAETGRIKIALRQETSRVLVDLSDDGAGLDLARIRAKAQARGMISADDELSDSEIQDLIFMAGFSTAERVTEVSGRGVGMDVVRNVVHSLGGDVRVGSRTGHGTIFALSLPLTLVVVQAAMVQVGGRPYGVPSSVVAQVSRCTGDELGAMYGSGTALWREQSFAFHSLAKLLGQSQPLPTLARNNIVLFLQSGDQRVAIHVESIARNQEIAIKDVGPQLSRVPGIAGASIGANGRALLLINPLYLATRGAEVVVPETKDESAQQAPLVLVVDDSVTVRKVTSRLMTRAGYRVQTAKDGVEALEQLHKEVPVVVLMDIEMPRMDGFELAQHIRTDRHLANLPLIMISSRTADKHRKHAESLGVNVFLGKPFHEEELLDHVRQFESAVMSTPTPALQLA